MQMTGNKMNTDSYVVNYHDHLQLQISKFSKSTPERTKEQLKSAMTRMMDSVGYHNIRIAALCDEARVAKGTFYIHFQDKEDIAAEVLSEYTTIQLQLIPDLYRIQNAYEALHRINMWFARSFVENIGLHRSLMQLSEEIPRIRDVWANYTSVITEAYVRDIFRRTKSEIQHDLAMLSVYSLGGMLDQALYAIHAVHRSPNFERLAASVEQLVETVSVLQFRAIYARDPAPGKLQFAREILQLQLKD